MVPHGALDRALVDIGLGVAWLREQGAETIVLLGNSGGGSLMAAYNAQCRGDVLTASFGVPLLPEVHDLPAAQTWRQPGGADRSYGIEVGRLAGLPKPVIERLKEEGYPLPHRSQ